MRLLLDVAARFLLQCIQHLDHIVVLEHLDGAQAHIHVLESLLASLHVLQQALVDNQLVLHGLGSYIISRHYLDLVLELFPVGVFQLGTSLLYPLEQSIKLYVNQEVLLGELLCQFGFIVSKIKCLFLLHAKVLLKFLL